MSRCVALVPSLAHCLLTFPTAFYKSVICCCCCLAWSVDQYRLCPLEKWPCTEQDFQQMPLDFVRGSQAIMWNNGTLYPIPHAAKYPPRGISRSESLFQLPLF